MESAAAPPRQLTGSWARQSECPEFRRLRKPRSLRKGLLAGERRAFDLRRMEQAYAAAYGRQLELTKHVSLALTDPAALLQLRSTGECTLVAPEMLFALDYPGHYMRRIPSACVTIAALNGPQRPVHKPQLCAHTHAQRLEANRRRRA